MKTKPILSMMVFTVFAIMTVAASKTTHANTVSNQGRICGRINEFNTGQLLALASIELFSSIDSTLVVGTLTNNRGEFGFSMLKPGDYFLVVSLEGFDTKQVQPVTVSNDDRKVETGDIHLNKVPRKPARNKSSKHVTYDQSIGQNLSHNR